MKSLNELSAQIHQEAKDKGFYDEPRETGTILMLIVSELSEALEADRKNRHANLQKFVGFTNMGFGKDYGTYLKEDAIPSFEENIKDTFEDEIADAFKRLFDLVGYLGIDIDKHIELKTKYNQLRPYKHGKKY